MPFEHRPLMARDRALAETVAFDRQSQRAIDVDGHLHVAQTPISKANVCEYYGAEIPDADVLGLEPTKKYKLLRDPKELEKGAASFNGKPLLSLHKPQSAGDRDKEDKEITVGAVRNPVFKAPYLFADLDVWDGDAIKGIEDGSQKELSCGYRYKADMTPGTYEGESYAGVMRDIVGNHVALVDEGRAGPDVVVADAKPPHLEIIFMSTKTKPMSRKAALVKGALTAILLPKLAKDAKMPDLGPIVAGVTVANWKNTKGEIVKALKPKFAADADLSDVVKLLDSLDGENPEEEAVVDDADPMAKLMGMLKEKGMDEKTCADVKTMMDEIMKPKAADEPPPFAGKPEAGGKEEAEDEDDDDMVTPAAMDAAIKAAVAGVSKTVKEETIAQMRGVVEAQEYVAPWVGKLAIACDSAADVYKGALEALKIDVTGMHPSAFKAVLAAQPKPGDRSQVRLAVDNATAEGFSTRFPDAAKVRNV